MNNRNRPHVSSMPTPHFPNNYSWTQPDNGYRPRPISERNRALVAQTLLRMDKDFIHLLRGCPTSWYVGVTVTQDRVELKIYDPEEVNDPNAVPRSWAPRTDQAGFLEVNKSQLFRELTAEERDRVLHTHPRFYSGRYLRPIEITMLDGLMETLGEKTKPAAAVREDDKDETTRELSIDKVDYSSGPSLES